MSPIHNSGGSQNFKNKRNERTQIENKVFGAGQLNNDWICQVALILAQKCTR